MNKKTLRFQYILSDALVAIIVWMLFTVFRRVVNDIRLFGDMPILVPNFNFYTTLVLFPITCGVIHSLSGYYNDVIKKTKLTEFFTTLIASGVISIIVFFVILLDDIVVGYEYYYQSLLVLFVLLFLLTFFFRMLIGRQIQKKFKTKEWTFNTLIVGTGKNAQAIALGIEKKSIFNTIVGFVKANKMEEEVVDSELVVGKFNDLDKIIPRFQIREIIIALDDATEYDIFDIINRLFHYDIDIKFTPRLYEILTGKVQIDRYGINPLVSVTKNTMPEWQQSIKRTLDIIISLLAIFVTLPLHLFFAIAIKLDSRGSIFYKQERIGLHGQPFNIYKFRTMFTNAEDNQPKLSSSTDERVTKFGRFLRKYRLDELPQFINVIKGDMSLVGPRPERQYYIDQIIEEAPYYCLTYRIRPGLTSWGPIKIGYADTLEKMIERLNYDIIYLENMSLATDMKIILLTLEVLFRGKGV